MIDQERRREALEKYLGKTPQPSIPQQHSQLLRNLLITTIGIIALFGIGSGVSRSLQNGYQTHLQAIRDFKEARHYHWLGQNNFYHIHRNLYLAAQKIRAANRLQKETIRLSSHYYLRI